MILPRFKRKPEPAVDANAETRPAAGRAVRRAVLLTAALTLLLVAGALFVLARQSGVRRWAVERLSPPTPPPRANPFELRQVVLADRDRAVRRGDLHEAAETNATLSHEALLRARAVHQAWLRLRHPATKLYGQARGKPEWNYRNTAADFFCFHLHAGLRLNPAGMPSLTETLAAEAALRTPAGLCRPVMADTGKVIDVDHDELMFGTSEYVKDGLLSVYERHGGGLIGDRMRALVDALIRQSRQGSKFGPLPGSGTEINGNMLQVCGRLSYAMGRADYAEFAARIADALVQQAMPANGGVPPKAFDYRSNKVLDPAVKLKDHGNEALLGLAEAYAMAVARGGEDPRWAERADRWAGPLAAMFQTVLTHGVNRDGLIVAAMSTSPPGPTSRDLSDNWGYVASGATLFTDAARRHGKVAADRLAAIDAAVERIARATFARPPTPWSGSMDSDADAVESALYLAAYRPALRPEAMRWADRQLDLLYRLQDSDGAVERFYLDGNFIRTSLMYADALSGGWRVEPWREDVEVGLAADGQGNAVVVVRTAEPYSGTLRPDQPRHRTVMNLPWDWARLNSWPEWHLVGDGVRVVSATGIDPPPTAGGLRRGVPLNLPALGSAALTLAGGPAATATSAPAP